VVDPGLRREPSSRSEFELPPGTTRAGPSALAGGLRTNPELIANPEVSVPGTKWALCAQEGAAGNFVESAMIAIEEAQTELKQAGCDTESGLAIAGRKLI
jgi:hypothetical protein